MQRIIGLLIATLFLLYVSLNTLLSGRFAIGRHGSIIIEGPIAIVAGVLVGGIGLVTGYALLQELWKGSTRDRSRHDD